MKLLSSLIETIIHKPEPTLLGRWRYVGSQKKGLDILEIKLKNKQNRHAYFKQVEVDKDLNYEKFLNRS